MIDFVLTGVIGGLLAANWQGFKDPPWEGFSIFKFLRSPILGGLAGLAAFGSIAAPPSSASTTWAS